LKSEEFGKGREGKGKERKGKEGGRRAGGKKAIKQRKEKKDSVLFCLDRVHGSKVNRTISRRLRSRFEIMNVSWPILLATNGFSEFFICHIAKTIVTIQTLYMENYYASEIACSFRNAEM
jgi:hypothetical protein